MRAPGFYPDIPEAEYHADRESLSVSGAKTLLKSPAKFRHRLDHPEHKDVFDFGTAAHRLVLGVGADIVVHEYDPKKVTSPKATKAWKEQQAAVRTEGGVLLLPDEMATVEAMADRLASHATAMSLLSNGRPEVSAYAPDIDTGVLRRGRFDWLNDDMLVDYKTAASCLPPVFGDAAAKFGYDMQAGWYLDLARDLGLDPRGFVFVVQEKEPPYEVACIQLNPAAVDSARSLNRAALERFRDCTAAGQWPGATPDRVVSADVPPWRYREAGEVAYNELENAS